MDTVTAVKWLLLEVEASKIYFEPRSQIRSKQGNKGRNGVLACPAVLTKLSRTYTVDAPYDLRLRFTGTKDRPEIRPVLSSTSLTFGKLKNQFVLTPKEQWATPDNPVFQIATPYVFTSDTPCYLTQSFPRELIGKQNPFRLIEGRFPIHSWLRPLSWAVEWININEDIIIRRGQPWFDVYFETSDLISSIGMSRHEMTEDIKKRLLETKDISSYIRGTSKLLGG